MSPKHTTIMPLTREELIKYKREIEPKDYRVVEHGTERILLIRSPQEFPDIVNDLEDMINRFDLRDTNQIDHACLIGDAEVVGVSIDAINSLIARRIEDDEKIAIDLGEKLIEPFSILIFESDEDPQKTLRLGIRVSGNLEDFKPQQLQELLFSQIKSLPRHSEVVYLIAENGHIRMSGKKFYSHLRDFLRENPEKNKELAKEFTDISRGNLAEYFVNKNGKDILLKAKTQEQLNNYIHEESDKGVSKAEVSETVLAGKRSESKQAKEKEQDGLSQKKQNVKVTEEVLNDESNKREITSDNSELSSKETVSHAVSVQKSALESDIDTDNDTSKKWPSNTSFLIQLKGKLSETGFNIIQGIEIPGVDVVANNPESIIKRVFFSYIPTFNLKKAMELDRSLQRYSPELSIIIGSITDTELKLFTVGKNAVIADINDILNSDFLNHIEEHI